MQHHAANWSDLKWTPRILQCIFKLSRIPVTCAHLIVPLCLFYIAFIFKCCHFFPLPSLSIEDLVFYLFWKCSSLATLSSFHHHYLASVHKSVWVFSTFFTSHWTSSPSPLSTPSMRISFLSQTSLPFILPGTYKLFSHFIQILARLIKKEKNILIPWDNTLLPICH